jgi:hypothetical protein
VSLFHRGRRLVTAFLLVLVLTVSTACSAAPTATSTDRSPSSVGTLQAPYQQLQRGNSTAGQNFGDWVIQTANGLVKDAFVRDDNKLGVVISPQVRPNDVKPLARSLLQGFEHNFPNRNLTVLMYAPDKKLILTARYNNQSRQIEYQG